MGIFSDAKQNLFITHIAELQFRSRLMAGVPMNPKLMVDWIASKTGLSDQDEVFLIAKRTMEEMGADVSQLTGLDDISKLADQIAKTTQTNGFKHDEHGLFIEGRQVKAMLKECINILYAGERWGRTAKGPKGFVAERVFIEQERIYLDRQEPDGSELVIGHVTGPKGPQSTLTLYQYVERPRISFGVQILSSAVEKELTPERWAMIWSLAEENGLGALRSQSYGKFDIERWEATGKVVDLAKRREGVA